jgi:alpha-glucosidase
MVEDVIDKYSQNGIPLETIYLDIPYMDKYSDFTVDKK